MNYLLRFACALAIEAVLALALWGLFLLLGATPVSSR